MATPNAELAYRVLDLASTHGDAFAMGSWAWHPDGRAVDLDDLTKNDCGTTACLAGWTVATAGYTIDADAAVYDSMGKKVGEADTIAAEMLGISADDASRIFYADDTNVEQRVAEIFGPRPGGES